MFFDTHTHVNFAAFKDDADATIQRALDNNTWLINVGTQINTSKSAVEMAKIYPKGVFAAIGLHPVHTFQQIVDEEEDHFKSHEEHFDPEVFQKLLTDKVVAVGECGLDYFHLPQQDQEAAIAKQKTEFSKQLHFARRNSLPVIIHCRDLPATQTNPLVGSAGAYEDVLSILKSEYAGGPGVIHSFTGNWETAQKFLDFGFYVAVNGILNFDTTGNLAEVVEKISLDRLLTETDAPYLTPPPFRGKRNEPSHVQYVIGKIAQIKQMDEPKVADLTFQNACKLFNIPA